MSEDLTRTGKDGSTEAEAAAAELEGSGDAAVVSGVEGSETLVGQAAAAKVVNQPAARQTEPVEVLPGQRIILNFDPALAQVEIDGKNFVLIFNEGTDDEARLVFLDLVTLAQGDDPPLLQVAGVIIGSDVLIGQAIALSGQQPDLETAAGQAGEPGHGANVYDDDLGTLIDLLGPQGVILPVFLQFPLPEPIEPLELVLADAPPPPSGVPLAFDNVADVETAVGDRNIVIVFDRSGSMTRDPRVDGFSARIDLSRAAVASLLAAAEGAGAVNVLIVDFATAASNSGWLSVEEANEYLAGLVAGGSTNYETAIDEVKAAFPVDTPTAELNVLHFLSDGIPNGGDFSDVAGWETFLDTNDITANAIGIGSGISPTDSDLEDVAYDGAADPAQQIDPIIVTDESQLIATLLSTLTVNAAGNVLTDPGPDPDNLVDTFGADGPGQIVSITVDTGLGGGDGITTFTYDPIADEITNEDGLATILTSDLVVTTDIGGEFTFDFLTGAYTYEASPENGGGAEIFDYTIEDADSDQSTATLTITVPGSSDFEGLPLIVDDTPNNDDVLNGTADAEILAGDRGNDTLNGLGGNDLLFGGRGADTLNGGEGDDILIGGRGNDLVTGGPGADIINVGSNASGGSPKPNSLNSQDTVFYTDVADFGDVIYNFDADGASHDTIDLDELFDNLGVATAARAGLVQIVDGGDVEEVRINADANPDFEVLLVTVNLTAGDLDIGTDIVLGTL